MSMPNGTDNSAVTPPTEPRFKLTLGNPGSFLTREAIDVLVAAGRIEISNVSGWAWRCWGCDENRFHLGSREAAEASAREHAADALHRLNRKRGR